MRKRILNLSTNIQYTATMTEEEISDELEKKIGCITVLFPIFFQNKLKNLERKNPEHANTICDYIIVEQTEFNISRL